ncbi:LpxI family protein [Candidatus Finniella inopinata]|uniref:LpxI family protein n=1 Tax=Candidatus Finniella inopinata TaxID=1696036 RepID=A0A4Q7DF58_9PROT|nr:UDP-2,3-diacylglucosamine diphosphatase LpxI [Candidatus Finniella inopinata]RZI45272.1 LpxI family protein [Candidatus Finniella inopinata]
MTLALIAGSGNLPVEILISCRDRNLVVVGFEGQTTPDLHPEMVLFPLGSIGKVLEYLREQEVTDIIFGGALRRPSWSELQLDKTGTQWLKKLGWKALKGDNDLLSGILDLLKHEGFNILKPSDVLDDLLAASGCLTIVQPNEQDLADIGRGADILKVLSLNDIGQSIVVQQGLVLGVEAIEGTAALIQRCDLLKRQGGGGVLVKIAKINQDQRIDLPTIGRETINQISQAGFAGIAVSAGTTQILDFHTVIKQANDLGVFVVGV